VEAKSYTLLTNRNLILGSALATFRRKIRASRKDGA
jgi:hypothetical protein